MVQLALLEPKSDRKARSLIHFERLQAILGDGRDWHYTGESAEDPGCAYVCSCGHHGLRFLFFIEHNTNGRRIGVGSSCIHQFESVNPQMVEGIRADHERQLEAAALREKNRKNSAIEDQAQDIIRQCHELAWAIDDRIVAIGPESASVTQLTRFTLGGATRRLRSKTPDAPHPLIQFKAYQRPSSLKNQAEKRLAELNFLFSEINRIKCGP